MCTASYFLQHELNFRRVYSLRSPIASISRKKQNQRREQSKAVIEVPSAVKSFFYTYKLPPLITF